MTPVCYCGKPIVITTEHPRTKYHAAYTSTHCARCGSAYSVEYGSKPPAALPSSPPAQDPE